MRALLMTFAALAGGCVATTEPGTDLDPKHETAPITTVRAGVEAQVAFAGPLEVELAADGATLRLVVVQRTQTGERRFDRTIRFAAGTADTAIAGRFAKALEQAGFAVDFEPSNCIFADDIIEIGGWSAPEGAYDLAFAGEDGLRVLRTPPARRD